MALTSQALADLAAIVGGANIDHSDEMRTCYAYDALKKAFPPDAVAFPGSAAEVSEILKLANGRSIPIVPRGGGSGYTGGSVPVEGGVVVSLERLDRIIDIDEENFIAVVEPGVITGVFQREVESKGLFYPPDPASLEFCTIGGNVAECAGGPRALKYGVTREYVMGLDVVLPTGEVIRTGGRTRKGVVGYDLTRLIVGSEGTLGIVTKVILKLLPLPPARQTLMAIYTDMGEAATAVREIIGSGVIPCTLEFMDGATIRCVAEHLGEAVRVGAEGAMLLIEIDGGAASVEDEALGISRILEKTGAAEAHRAASAEESERLWRARRAISPSLAKRSPNKVSHDIAVPIARLPEMIKEIRTLAEAYEIDIMNFGHAGDGNIHVNFMVDPKDTALMARTGKAVEALFEITLKLGGTISGEHGVGISKMPYIAMELEPEMIRLQRAIKTAIDPRGILNPGKIFAPVRRDGPGER